MTLSNPLCLEIESLRAQVNAVAQVALHACAILERSGLVDGQQLTSELLGLRWPEPMHAQTHLVMDELCALLGDARSRRQHWEQPEEAHNLESGY